jgi:hypothetical protein
LFENETGKLKLKTVMPHLKETIDGTWIHGVANEKRFEDTTFMEEEISDPCRDRRGRLKR